MIHDLLMEKTIDIEERLLRDHLCEEIVATAGVLYEIKIEREKNKKGRLLGMQLKMLVVKNYAQSRYQIAKRDDFVYTELLKYLPQVLVEEVSTFLHNGENCLRCNIRLEYWKFGNQWCGLCHNIFCGTCKTMHYKYVTHPHVGWDCIYNIEKLDFYSIAESHLIRNRQSPKKRKTK